MLFTPKNVKKFQQGGALPVEEPIAPEAAPTQEPEMVENQQDPLLMIAEAAVRAVQSQDCGLAMQVCQGLLSLLQQASGNASEQTKGEPVFKKGGVLLRRIKK